jgi:LEA14-like dessication related protein
VWIQGLMAVLLTACAMGQKFEQPKLEVVNVEMLKGDLFKQELRVRMRVENPNDRALPVRGISYQMEVAGKPFASGESEKNFEVPAKGTAEFDVSASVNGAGTLLGLLSSGKKVDSVDYRVFGKVSLAKGLLRNIPFDEKGVFKLQ